MTLVSWDLVSFLAIESSLSKRFIRRHDLTPRLEAVSVFLLRQWEPPIAVLSVIALWALLQANLLARTAGHQHRRGEGVLVVLEAARAVSRFVLDFLSGHAAAFRFDTVPSLLSVLWYS